MRTQRQVKDSEKSGWLIGARDMLAVIGVIGCFILFALGIFSTLSIQFKLALSVCLLCLLHMAVDAIRKEGLNKENAICIVGFAFLCYQVWG